MEFALMRTADLLLRPAAVIFLLLLAGVWLVKRHPRAGRVLAAAGTVLLYLLSTGIGASLVMKPLEAGYRPLDPAEAKADAIVVLSGDVKRFPWHDVKVVPSSDSLERVVAATALYRKTGLPVVISGGKSDPNGDGFCEAEAMAAVAYALGVPRQDVRVECASVDTLQNARETAKTLGGKRIVLVTSAYHMKRASSVFRLQGFAVIPAPAGFAGDDEPVSVYTLIPRARNLLVADAALHEYLGYAWYGLRGGL